MKMRVFLLAVLGLTGIPALAAPSAITQASAGVTNYSFFVLKAKKLRDMTVARGTANLAAALQPYGVTPCVVESDTNASIACGAPSSPTFMLPLPGEFFTYDLAFNFHDLPPIDDRQVFNKDSAYNQVYAVNFKSPVGTTPGDTSGRVPIHVRFAVPVSEFSMRVDSGNPLAPASGAIQFEVNGVAIEPQPLAVGAPTFVGVQDPAGFTEVTIIPVGGQSQAFIGDSFSFLPRQ